MQSLKNYAIINKKPVKDGDSMATLKRIKIDGFKSIKHCDVSLGNINVLIGANGAGKSNFVSTFMLVQNVIRKNLQRYVVESGIDTIFYNGTPETNELSVECHFGNNGYGFVLSPTEDRSVFFKDEYRLWHKSPTETVTERLMSNHTESVWDQPSRNWIKEYVDDSLANLSWRVYHFNDTTSKAKIKRTATIGDTDGLLQDGGNLAAYLYHLKCYHPTEYRKIRHTINLVAPYFDDFYLVPYGKEQEYVDLRWKQNGTDQVMMPSQFSDGTLRFICLATLLMQPERYLPSTIIIDEPEIGLHPYSVIIFSEMVKSLAANGHQIILSTQSAELLNQFSANDVIVVDRGAEGSKFTRLDESQLTQWLDDYSLGDLWNMNIFGGRLTQCD